jgi:glutathione S-transferase
MTTRLYYAPRTRSFTVLWLLEELGEPYELEVMSLQDGSHKSEAHLARNSMGKVPVVESDGQVLSETGAIALFLTERSPSRGLAPAVSDPRRGAFLRWMFFSGSVIEPCLGEKFFKWTVRASHVAWGSHADMIKTVEGALKDRPYLLGQTFSAADVVVGASLRFGMMFKGIAQTDPIASYVARLEARDAFRRAMVIEEEHAKTLS